MDYAKLYFHLFNALTDAIVLLEEEDCDGARELLLQAQRKTENLYTTQPEETEIE